jgi:hypothetical protein
VIPGIGWDGGVAAHPREAERRERQDAGDPPSGWAGKPEVKEEK